MIPLDKREKIIREKHRYGYFNIEFKEHVSKKYMLSVNTFYWYFRHGDFMFRISKDISSDSGYFFEFYCIPYMQMQRLLKMQINNPYIIYQKHFKTFKEAKNDAQNLYLKFCTVFYKGKI